MSVNVMIELSNGQRVKIPVNGNTLLHLDEQGNPTLKSFSETNRLLITAPTGGGDTALDGLNVKFWQIGEGVLVAEEANFSVWKLISGTNATDAEAGYVRPADYDGTTNARVFQRIALIPNTDENGNIVATVLPRSGTAAALAAVVPEAGEWVYVTDLDKMVHGDGTSTVAALLLDKDIIIATTPFFPDNNQTTEVGYYIPGPDLEPTLTMTLSAGKWILEFYLVFESYSYDVTGCRLVLFYTGGGDWNSQYSVGCDVTNSPFGATKTANALYQCYIYWSNNPAINTTVSGYNNTVRGTQAIRIDEDLTFTLYFGPADGSSDAAVLYSQSYIKATRVS